MWAEKPSSRGVSATSEFDEEETLHIFAEEVCVLIKPQGRDHYTAQLTVRLWPDNPGHPRSLLLELTDENDLLFYHSLALGEGDFHALRSEQRLVVDFQSFPERLADLLRRCSEAAGSKMIASLECGAESRLSIVESTDFREIVYIDLRLRQGSDEVVKRHLAKKLRASRAEAQQLAARLSSSSEALQQSRKQGEELAARARVVADERSHLENSLQATHQRELAALKEEHARALSELQRKTSEERSRLELEQQQALRAALDRASKAEAANEELNHTRQSLTASGESCQKRLAEAEKELNEATQETRELKRQLKQLEEQKFRHERELSELKVLLASTREQLAVREQHASSQALQIEEAVSQRRMQDDTLTSLKKQVQSLEEQFAVSSQEITKGNRIIQTLHQATKEAKAKLRQKSTELVEFEKARLEWEKDGQLKSHVMEEKDSEVRRVLAREEKLQQDVEEMKRKLVEAHDVIKSNAETIEYLNRKLTEKELKTMPSSAPTTWHTESSFRGSSSLAELLGKVESMAPKGLGIPTSPGYGGGHVSSLNLSSLTPSPAKAYTPSTTASSPEDFLKKPVAYRRPEALLGKVV